MHSDLPTACGIYGPRLLIVGGPCALQCADHTLVQTTHRRRQSRRFLALQGRCLDRGQGFTSLAELRAPSGLGCTPVGAFFNRSVAGHRTPGSCRWVTVVMASKSFLTTTHYLLRSSFPVSLKRLHTQFVYSITNTAAHGPSRFMESCGVQPSTAQQRRVCFCGSCAFL